MGRCCSEGEFSAKASKGGGGEVWCYDLMCYDLGYNEIRETRLAA